jgi:hypothetical protein
MDCLIVVIVKFDPEYVPAMSQGYILYIYVGNSQRCAKRCIE